MLTARHAVEGMHFGTISIRVGYQLRSSGLDYGHNVFVLGFVEANKALDYVILVLSKPAAGITLTSFNLEPTFTGNSIFIHHLDIPIMVFTILLQVF